VARLDEAIELRDAGVEAPILIFGSTPAKAASLLVERNLTQTVFSLSMAEAYSRQAIDLARPLRAHIKIDTGMGRLGVLATEAPVDRRLHEVESIARLPGLEIEGLFTHFATADSADTSYAELQLRRFRELIAALEDGGLHIPLKHAANSAALIQDPESHLDLVRPGIATYGLQPSSEWRRGDLDLQTALAWKTRIVHLKQVPAGFGVSYGITYKTRRPTTLATVAVGYGDGLSVALSSRGQMLVRGRRVPIVGRVCMDLTLLDVGEVPAAAVGDEVVILGRQGTLEITAEELAATLETINYEIVTSIAARVPRVYVDGS
jgi:alanine racemase